MTIQKQDPVSVLGIIYPSLNSDLKFKLKYQEFERSLILRQGAFIILQTVSAKDCFFGISGGIIVSSRRAAQPVSGYNVKEIAGACSYCNNPSWLKGAPLKLCLSTTDP